MIRVGKNEDKRAIYELYNRNSDYNLVDERYYFHSGFIAENALVNEVNGHIVSSLQIDYYPINLHNKKVEIGIMHGIVSDATKDNKYGKELLEKALGYQEYRSLITLVPAYYQIDFNKFGFQNTYKERVYTITRSDLSNTSYSGVNKNYSIPELKELYKQFTKSVNGYMVRDKQYWDNLVDCLKERRYNLGVYYDQDNKAQGYIIYYIDVNKVIVNEVVYLNGLALTRLLCYVLRLKNQLEVHASEHENLLKAYPKIKYCVVSKYFAKINDIKLFNKLYDCNIKDSEKGFYLNNEPLYLNHIL